MTGGRRLGRLTLSVLWTACLMFVGAPDPAHGAGGPAEFRDCDQCPVMVVIPEGTYRMGAEASERERLDTIRGFEYDDEFPVRDVKVSRFAIGKYEVTIDEFAEFVRSTSRTVTGCAFLVPPGRFELDASRAWDNLPWPVTGRHPVTCVNWEDAEAYARWLRSKTGKSYRLPSEAEWEYVARAGSQTPWPWGDNPNDACKFANLGDETFRQRFPNYGGPNWPFARCRDGHVTAAPTGSFPPNAFGVHDMIGNVWEWVQDCRGRYPSLPTDASPVVTGWLVDCSRRRFRGGSAWTQPPHARSASRAAPPARDRFFHVGFRVAVSFD